MTERYFDPESSSYGLLVTTIAADYLKEEINALACSRNLVMEVKTKTDDSPVTEYDRAAERLIGGLYSETAVCVKGEEGVNDWPAGKAPSLDVHVDPIDGTALLVQHVQGLNRWMHLPSNARPSRPVCGSMVSVGALRPGSNEPEWGAIAAPFMLPSGIVRWTAGTDQPAVRIEPDGSQYELPQASTLPAPETGGVVLVASDSAERDFGDALRAEGLRVVKYKSAVAIALCAMDPGLLGRLMPEEVGDDPIVGVVMRSARNWDVAAAMALAKSLGHFASDIHGRPRTFEEGATGIVLAPSRAIGRTLVNAVKIA